MLTNMGTGLPGLFFKNVKYQINTHLKGVVLAGKCSSSNSAKYTPLMEAHERAKSCPLRDHTFKRKISKRAGVYGDNFTLSQKNNWLNHF